MFWYLVFGALFCVYQADVLVYSIIAFVALLRERLWPVPGHPAYERKHPSQYVTPPPLSSASSLARAARASAT